MVGDEPLAFVQSGYCGDDVVVAIDPATGATVWRTPPDVAVGEQTIDSGVIAPVFGNVLVTQVVQPDQLLMVGLDIATGQPKWTIGGGVVLAASAAALVVWSLREGIVRVIDPATGSELWTVRTNAPIDVDTTEPPTAGEALPEVTAAAGDGLVYLDVDKTITGSDAATGTQRWSVAMPGSPSGPANIAAGGDVVLVEDGGGITALDATTGAERWTVPNTTDVEQLSLHDGFVADGNLYLPGPPSVMAIDLATGQTRWSMPIAMGLGIELIAAGGGRVLIQDQNNRLHLKDAVTGAEEWDAAVAAQRTLTGGTYQLDNDTIYITWPCGGG